MNIPIRIPKWVFNRSNIYVKQKSKEIIVNIILEQDRIMFRRDARYLLKTLVDFN